MKTLRILCLSFAALVFAGSVFAVADGLKKNNKEQVVNATALGCLAIAMPAVADPNIKKSIAGFMGGGLSRDEETLLAFLEQSGYVDPNTLNAYKARKIRFVDANYYVRKLITGLNGVQPIMDERLNKATGITNIHQGKLTKGENSVISQILVGYATDAAIVDPINKVYDSVVTGWPTGLANGHLIIEQDGSPVSDPIPLALCGSQADATSARGMVDSKKLRTPFILEEEKQIVIKIDFPLASFAANQHLIEIFLLGSKTRVRTGR
jgi:hypothetical protein